ncbi:hypothetical protein [Scandinavium lactucae]|uniref:Uncharacterized protein n=1 Tax=Scandinavium lactucae TaxID=3095028 RepID=A0ABU4QKW5_9ENTR|nr:MULTISPECIES: hypothetical protein [unclassified Scandinavium]MDX6039009.1 hypothetical protein [Scandinavium sp. V105_6]MDX6050080.1 hypothetical protein [Scandinavium sp. V105_1]
MRLGELVEGRISEGPPMQPRVGQKVTLPQGGHSQGQGNANIWNALLPS